MRGSLNKARKNPKPANIKNKNQKEAMEPHRSKDQLFINISTTSPTFPIVTDSLSTRKILLTTNSKEYYTHRSTNDII